MSREPHRSKHAGWGGAAAALLSLLVAACPACPPRVAPPTTDVGAQPYKLPELVPGYIPKCPAHLIGFQMVVDSGTHGEHDWKLITVTDIPLSGELDDVPEAHDCQRLVVQNGTTRAYGPLAAIFAAEALDARDFYAARQGEGVRAIATIYAYPSPYAPLRIAPGVNCLYVFPTGGGGLAARMVQVRHPQDCDLPLLDPRPDGALEVRLDPMAGPPDEIPAVARWDGNFTVAGRNQHHIGIRCGDGWCEIGPRGFLSAPSRDVGMVSRRMARRAAAAPGQADALRIVRNRGWYDEQLLAVKPTPDAPLEVGPVVATLLPHPQLAQLTTADDFKPRWVEVATAYLPDSIPGYKAKLNLEAGVNVFEMRMATRAALVAEGTTISSECPAGGAGEAWWIRVTSAGSRDQAVYCATRFSHAGKPTRLPGAVRWQWLENDEKTWFACDQGCCYRH